MPERLTTLEDLNLDYEKLALRENFRDIFELTRKEKIVIADRIKKYNGSAWVWVHSFFDIENFEEYKKSLQSNLPTEPIRQGLLASLRKSPDQTPQSIVFAQKERMSEIKAILEAMMNGSGNYPLLVPTSSNSSTPELVGENFVDKTRQLLFDVRWKSLLPILTEDLGVKKVHMAGQYFKIKRRPIELKKYKNAVGNPNLSERERARNLPLGYFLSECVGEAANHLNNAKIEVLYTNLSHPNSRKTFLDILNGNDEESPGT